MDAAAAASSPLLRKTVVDNDDDDDVDDVDETCNVHVHTALATSHTHNSHRDSGVRVQGGFASSSFVVAAVVAAVVVVVVVVVVVTQGSLSFVSVATGAGAVASLGAE